MDTTLVDNIATEEEVSFFKSQIKILTAIAAIAGLAGLLFGFDAFITIAAFVSLLGVFIGALYSPIMGFLSISILIVLDPMIRSYVLVGGLFRWNTINYWLIIFSALNFRLLTHNLTRHIKSAIAFIVLLLIQLAYSSDIENGVLSILGFFSIIALYAYMLSVRQYNTKLMLYYVSLVTSVSGIMAGSLFYYTYGFQAYNLTYYYKLGLSVTEMDLVNANSFAVTLVASIMVTTVAYSFIKEKRHRLILLVLTLSNLFLLIFTGSRGGLLTGLVSLYFIITKKTNALKLIFYALICYILLSMSAPLLKDVNNSIARKIYILFQDDASVSRKTNDRSDIAYIGYQIFLDNPLGVGTGNFSYTFKNFTTYSYSDLSISQTQKQSHSAFIKIMTENGIFGLLVFGIFFGTYYYKKSNPLYKNGIYFIIVAGTVFLSTEFQHKPIWFVGAIVAYLSTIEDEELEEQLV